MTVDPNQLKESWLEQALAGAGIDRETWRPERGVEENRPTVEAVYGYYGRLFLEHPQLQWAGMASMIGPAFYAGFRDLGALPDAARRFVAAVARRASPRLAALAAGDLGFYETTLLTMQKKIFEDQAPMHEAYLAGGAAEIERLCRAGIVDAATLAGWQQIDAGHETADAKLVDRGNRVLLLREQRDIIDLFYARMLRYRRLEGPAFTYLMTLAGAPSVPGAKSYAEAFPLTFVVRLPLAAVSLRTPLADGNIAVFANRWKLIDDDTLPDYLRYLRDSPGSARALVGTPIAERTPSFRLAARAGALAAAALSGWDLDIGPARRLSPGLAIASTKPVLQARTGATAIDLRTPPSRASADFAPSTDSRVWMNAPGRPFDIAVVLPGGRQYQARAEMAVMLSSERGADPDHLTVRLPPADIEATEQVIARYSAEWSLPAGAAAAWRRAAERRTSSDRDYATHVLSPGDAGFVHVDFQMSHHVVEDFFVVAALFSWGAAAPATVDGAPPTP